MSLELKKNEAELARVKAARLEQEYIIAQREDEIERLKKNINIQIAKESELESNIEKLRSK